MQALENNSYTCPEFVDDYRLLVVLTPADDAPPCILLLDTENDVGGGMPVQTLFHLPSHWTTTKPLSLFLERGAHKPSSTDYLAPFYQDPTQRIAVFDTFNQFPYLVFPVETLLKLARDRGGCEVEWDRWNKHVAFFPSLRYGRYDPADTWVSGCRFFRFRNTPDAEIEVYDFSVRGRIRHQSEQTDSHLGVVKCLQPTRAKQHIPWCRDPDNFFVIGGGRESVVFYRVSALRVSHAARLNGVLYVAA